MEMIAEQDSDIRGKLQHIDEGKTYEIISDILKDEYPSITRSLSARSVRRFCASNRISKKKGAQLDAVVAQSVSEVC